MTAITALLITVLIAVVIILGILLVTAFYDSDRVRATEQFLLGSAYGLTVAAVLATLFTLTIN